MRVAVPFGIALKKITCTGLLRRLCSSLTRSSSQHLRPCKRRERITSRSKQVPCCHPLGDGLACESPVSPVPIPLALGRAAARRATMHPATAFSSDLGRSAWRAGPCRRPHPDEDRWSPSGSPSPTCAYQSINPARAWTSLPLPGESLRDFAQDRVHLRVRECSEGLRAMVACFAKGQSKRG